MHEYNPREIKESDWKLWRALSKEALERHCQKTLTEAARLATGEESAHERYLKLYRLIQRRDREITEVFDDPRRSKAYLQIARALHKKIISRAELERFSEETREFVGELAGLRD